MRKKWPLFLGILLLTVGIVLRKTTDFSQAGLIILVTGVSLKVYYIINKARTGEYHVGWELLYLAFGLMLFFTGLYFRRNDFEFNGYWLMFPGIALKVLFILMFIKKTRSNA